MPEVKFYFTKYIYNTHYYQIWEALTLISIYGGVKRKDYFNSFTITCTLCHEYIT